MSKPIIGITCDLYHSDQDGAYGPQYSLRSNYCEMVVRAGGVPVIIPTVTDVQAIASMLDGVLIPGGKDIDPVHFGQERHPEASLQDPSRFKTESALHDSISEETPVFGICYGSQFVNVKQGGTLHQHIPDQLGHRQHEGGTLQTYLVESDSLFHQLVKDSEVSGMSYHHQAIDALGGELRVVAQHEDGTIEAIEGTGKRWVVAVQWHPERTPDNPASIRLFEAFIAAAKKNKEARGT